MRLTRGIHHVGHYTRDLDRTLDFYTRILGFTVARADRVRVEEGGQVRHVFLDMGNNEMLAFMAPEGVEGVEMPPKEGVSITHHIAFEALGPEALEVIRQKLIAEDVKVSGVVQHDWCRSIYFDDPVNNIRLECCSSYRELNDDDATMQDRHTIKAAQMQEAPYERATYIK